MSEGTLIQPPDAGSDDLVEENRAFWREAGKALVKGSIDATDGIAKQLIAVAGILVGLYFNAIAFSDLRDPAKFPALLLQNNLLTFLAPIALLLISLVFALLVFFPRRYNLNIQSWEASKLVFERIAARKLMWVRLSSIFLILGVLGTLNAAWVYLANRV